MIQPIKMSTLLLPRAFKKFNCFDYEDKMGCSDEFYRKYDIGEMIDVKPSYNPLEKAIFYDTKRHFEIYCLRNILYVTRGFLVKEHLYEYLCGYRLANHVAYRGIKREFEGEIIRDLVFVYFYNDLSRSIDYSKSIYWLLRKGYDTRDKEKEGIEPYIVEDNIRLSGLEEWDEKYGDYNKKGLKLKVKYLYCPDMIGYDMFGFEDFHSGIFVSEQLRHDLEKRKTKGLDFWRNVYFEFFGKE